MFKLPSQPRVTIIMLMLPLLLACVTDKSMTQANGNCVPAASPSAEQAQYFALAQAYLKANPGSHRVTDPCKELLFIAERIDDLQQKHVRFQQSYEGIAVWGQQLIVHFNAQDRVTSTTGSIIPIAQKISVEPTLDKEIAANAAINAIGDNAKAQDSQLFIYLHEGVPRLVHKLNVMKSLRRTTVFVDAENGVVLNQISASPSQN